MTLWLPFPIIDPVLIEFGRIGDVPVAVRWYGVLWITGCLLAWWNAIKYFERSHQLVTRKDIDDFLICPHFTNKKYKNTNISFFSEYRKPNPGMITTLANKYRINLF